MKPHVLVVGGLRPMHKVLSRLGVRMTLLNPVHRIQGGDALLYDRVVAISANATQAEWVEFANVIHQLDPITAVGAFHEMNQDIAAVIAQKIGVPFHAPEVVQRVRDKSLTRACLREAGVDPTMGQVVGSAEEVEQFGREYGYPVILKPLDGWGSIGISRIDNPGDVRSALEWFAKSAPNSRMYVESCIMGEEFSVEAFSEQGEHRVLNITRKYKEPIHFVEIGHSLPALLDTQEGAQVEQFVIKVLTALGVQQGPTHTEVILSPDGPRVVETHTRLGGDYIPDLIEAVSGVNVMELWARQSLGQQVLPEVPRLTGEKHAAIWYNTPSALGTIEAVRGETEAQEVPGVVKVHVLQGGGTELAGMSDSFTRSAYSIATGSSSEEALTRAQEAVGKLRFVVACK